MNESKDILNFIPVSVYCSDAVQRFYVEWQDKMTLSEFVETVLIERRDEYGSIREPNWGRIILEYKKGNILFQSEDYEYIKYLRIKHIIGVGGWSLMDYEVKLTNKVISKLVKFFRGIFFSKS